MDGAGHNSAFIAKRDQPVKQALTDAFLGKVKSKDFSKKSNEDQVMDLKMTLRKAQMYQTDSMATTRAKDRKLLNDSIKARKMTDETFMMKKELDKDEINKVRKDINNPEYDDLDKKILQEVFDALDSKTHSKINELLNDPLKGPQVARYLELLTSGGSATLPSYVMAQVRENPEATDDSKNVIVAQNGDYCFGTYDPSTGKHEWHYEIKTPEPKVFMLESLKKGTIFYAISDGGSEFLHKEKIEEIIRDNAHKPEKIQSELIKAIKNHAGEGRLQASKEPQDASEPNNADTTEKMTQRMTGYDTKQMAKNMKNYQADLCKAWNPNDAASYDDFSGFFLTI